MLVTLFVKTYVLNCVLSGVLISNKKQGTGSTQKW